MLAYRINDAEHALWGSLNGHTFDLRDTHAASDVVARSGLDWQVSQQPIATLGQDGIRRQIQSHVANVRSDTGRVLGVVGRDYKPLQNRDALGLAEAIVDASQAGWVCAGSTRDGARIHALLRLPRDVRIAGQDSERVLPLLHLSNGHDGGLALTITATPFRLVCLNGMLLPISGAQRTWKARHTPKITGRLVEARRALELSFTYYAQLEELGTQLANQRMTRLEFARFVEQLVPIPPDIDPTDGGRRLGNVERVREAIRSLHQADDLNNVRHTRWGALQAVTAYTTHTQPIRATRARPLTDARFERATSPTSLVDRATQLLTQP